MNHLEDSTIMLMVPGPTIRAMVGIGQAVEARLEAALSTTGLTWPQYEVIQTLARESAPPMLSELADRVKCVRSNMTALVDRLERRGFVRRVPHPEDRRSIRVELTDKGTDACANALQILTQVESELLETISAEEQKVLRDVVSRLRSC